MTVLWAYINHFIPIINYSLRDIGYSRAFISFGRINPSWMNPNPKNLYLYALLYNRYIGYYKSEKKTGKNLISQIWNVHSR